MARVCKSLKIGLACKDYYLRWGLSTSINYLLMIGTTLICLAANSLLQIGRLKQLKPWLVRRNSVLKSRPKRVNKLPAAAQHVTEPPGCDLFVVHQSSADFKLRWVQNDPKLLQDLSTLLKCLQMTSMPSNFPATTHHRTVKLHQKVCNEVILRLTALYVTKLPKIDMRRRRMLCCNIRKIILT